MFSTKIEKLEFFDDHLISLATEILSIGKSCVINNCLAQEINSKGFVLTNPLNRWVCNPNSQHNTFLQIAKTLWTVCGHADISWLKRFLKNKQVSSQHSTVHWSSKAAVNPIQHVYEILLNDLQSRHAAISSWNAHFNCLIEESHETPFNSQVQFLVRNNHLHITVQTRNEELFEQLIDNVVKWTLIQELMAGWLNLKIGQYSHHVSSLCLYEHNQQLARNMLSANFERFNTNTQLKIPCFSESLQLLNFIKDVETMLCSTPENQDAFLKNLGIDVSLNDEISDDLSHTGNYAEFLNLFSLPIFYDRDKLIDCIPLNGLPQSLINSLRLPKM